MTKQKIYLISFIIITIVLCNCAVKTEYINDESVKSEWVEWIKNNHKVIENLQPDNLDYSDLKFLETLLADKSLVQLGENSHGVSEFNQAKVRLIKFLHQKMGFTVIAFESSIFECNMAQQNIQELPAVDLMGQSVFGVWHCQETLELFEYIKETQLTDNPLKLAGFDVQRSSSVGASKRADTFYQVIKTIDQKYAQMVYDMELEYENNIYSNSWLSSNKSDLDVFYTNLYQWFDQNQQILAANFSQTPLLPSILRQTAWSMIPKINCFLAQENLTEYYNIRDLGMATNVKWLREEFFKGEKMILWTHNGHMQHHGTAIQGGGPIARANNMGYWLSRWFSDEIYSIGFFMYQGEVASAGRAVYDLPDYKSDSLEAILAHTNTEFCYVNFLDEVENPGNSWIFNYLTSTEWEDRAEREDEIIIHKDHFNGIFFIRNVNPPDYLTYFGF